MNHLGGHCNKTHTDQGALDVFKDQYRIHSMLDVGCGPGGMFEIADKLGIDWTGIDGDPQVLKVNPAMPKSFLLHDYTKGPAPLPLTLGYDLGWSVEFLEHVEERFLPNVMHTFRLCQRLLVTAAPPGKFGHHHVNCREPEYWIEQFMHYGFWHNKEMTNWVRRHSTMKREFVREYALVFEMN